MGSMKCAVFYGRHDIRLEERPVPHIGSGEVLVKIEACGICGTDAGMYDGKIGYGEHTVGKIFGHEATGIVHDVGGDVRRVETGDRVVVAPVYYCGECMHCIAGDENLCMNWVCIGEEADGGYAEYIRVPERQVYSLPDNIGFVEGTLLADPVPTPLHAMRSRAHIKPGDSVAVWGTGPQGFCALQIAKLSGATVVVIARKKEKLLLARKLGADAVVNSETEDVRESLLHLYPYGVDFCIESGGYPEAVSQALACVKRGGRIVMIGLQKPLTVDIEDMLWGEKELVASVSSTYREFEIGIQLAGAKQIYLKPLVTHRFSLESIKEAFDLLTRRDEVVIKAVVIP